jgi:hypothetical protein
MGKSPINVVVLLGVGAGQARVDGSDPSGTLLARPAGGASLPTVTARRVGGTRYPPIWMNSAAAGLGPVAAQNGLIGIGLRLAGLKLRCQARHFGSTGLCGPIAPDAMA